MLMELGLAAALGLNSMFYNENTPKNIKSSETGVIPSISLEAKLGKKDLGLKYEGKLSTGLTEFNGTDQKGNPVVNSTGNNVSKHEVSALWNSLEVGVRKKVWDRFIGYMETFDDTDLILGYNHDNGDGLKASLKAYLGLDSKMDIDWQDDSGNDTTHMERKPGNGIKFEVEKKFKDFVLGGGISYDHLGGSDKTDIKRNGKKVGNVYYPSGDKLGLEFYFKKDL